MGSQWLKLSLLQKLYTDRSLSEVLFGLQKRCILQCLVRQWTSGVRRKNAEWFKAHPTGEYRGDLG